MSSRVAVSLSIAVVAVLVAAGLFQALSRSQLAVKPAVERDIFGAPVAEKPTPLIRDEIPEPPLNEIQQPALPNQILDPVATLPAPAEPWVPPQIMAPGG